MLYDDTEQLEVRYVISLAHYAVDIYAGGEPIPEGELFIKRNCIRLERRTDLDSGASELKPFFLFSDNSSEKEDFYHALLQSRERKEVNKDTSPTPLHFEQSHIIKLVQQLHASGENLQTRWFNALLSRIFLALYKTADMESYIREKITKKIARVPKPALISSITLQRISMGDSAPIITNPKLRELTIDGDLTIEADVRYNGNFRLEIAAVARIDLGPRFKVREVNMILAGILKKLEGHLLIRIKPPPSNRAWITFETMPKFELSIEPVVSSRQITYGIILRAIESRVREVVGDTIVLPNWDDSPFSDTTLKRFRAGIWEDDQPAKDFPDPRTTTIQATVAEPGGDQSDSDDSAVPSIAPLGPKDKTMSMPTLFDQASASLNPRTPAKSSTAPLDPNTEAISSGLRDRQKAGAPKAMRSRSFASAAQPVLSVEPATVNTSRSEPKKGQLDATKAVKDIHSRSCSTSPTESPVGTPPQQSLLSQLSADRIVSASYPDLALREDNGLTLAGSTVELPSAPRRTSRSSSFTLSTSRPQSTSSTDIPAITPAAQTSTNQELTADAASTASSAVSVAADLTAALSSSERRATLNQSLANATATAKKWGFGMLSRQGDAASGSPNTVTTTVLTEPMGRGHPLPPPGTPLPRPAKTMTGWASRLTRKPVPQSVPSGSARIMNDADKEREQNVNTQSNPSAPPLPRRPNRLTTASTAEPYVGHDNATNEDSLLVVEAPSESLPTTPQAETAPEEIFQGMEFEDEDHERAKFSEIHAVNASGPEEAAQTREAVGRNARIEAKPENQRLKKA